MKRLFFLLLLFPIYFSCGRKTSESLKDQVCLVPSDTISFLIDDSTYYESKAMFQFEDQGREYLCFQNNRNRGVSRLIIFDIEKECVYKSVPLRKEGPDGMPSVMGGYPLDMNHFLITSNSPFFYMVDDKGRILFKSEPLYQGHGDFGRFAPTFFLSYISTPAILRDSLFYFPQTQIGYPHTKDTWRTSNIFASVNLQTGQLNTTQFCYPSIFNKEEITRTLSYESGHSYADTGREVAVSFWKSDSIYVSSDFNRVRAHNAKSRYFPHLHPEPYDATIDLLVRLRKEAQEPEYHHLLYDKYRHVFYRFACMPYEYPADRSPMGEDSGREFSIIILNDRYEIIGETKFPGSTYAYRLWFIGKKGLYLSLNNQENPCFDEDKLMFRCFTLQENK